jgi:hypothetical protein
MSIKSSIKSLTKAPILNKLFTNVYVLYFVAGLAFLSVIGNLMANKFTTVAFFIIVFLLTKHFSNNMIIVLLVPLIFTAIFNIEKATREGMDDGTGSSSDNSSGNVSVVNSTVTVTDDPSITTPQVTSSYDTSSSMSDTNNTIKMIEEAEGFEIGDQKQKRTYEVDHAATLKQSYSDLSKSLGPDGIRKLTEDTTSLLKQQAELGQAIKNMEPLIAGMAPLMKTAQGIFGSLGASPEGGAPSGDLSSLLAMANKLGGSTAASQASSV